MKYEELKVGLKVKHRVSGDILTVEQIGGKGWFRSDQARWFKSEDVEPHEKQYKIEAAFIVDKTLFRTREAALEHLTRIRVFEKLRQVFGNGVPPTAQSEILDVLIEKLLTDRAEFADILKATE